MDLADPGLVFGRYRHGGNLAKRQRLAGFTLLMDDGVGHFGYCLDATPYRR